jgi:hypothetical protein
MQRGGGRNSRIGILKTSDQQFSRFASRIAARPETSSRDSVRKIGLAAARQVDRSFKAVNSQN